MIKNDELILENQKLVYSIINTYFPNYQNKNDLFQVGCMGLIKASEKFNEEYNTKFSTYAYTLILGEIKKYVREDKGIKLSYDLQKLGYKIEKLRLILYQKLMREPTTSELASIIGVSETQIIEALSMPNNIQSLDEPINDNGKCINLYDYVSDNRKQDINELIDLKRELEKLSKEEKMIIESRYMKDMTQTETAEALGMSQVQISRNEKKVLIKLRDRLQM